MPIPAYKKGYRLFANSHLPEKITVFGVGQRNQDIYNADELDRLLGKTVITLSLIHISCGMGNFFNFLPNERNAYGCEVDPNACAVARMSPCTMCACG